MLLPAQVCAFACVAPENMILEDGCFTFLQLLIGCIRKQIDFLGERFLCQAAVHSKLDHHDGLLSMQRRRILLELPPNQRTAQLLFPIVQARH